MHRWAIEHNRIKESDQRIKRIIENFKAIEKERRDAGVARPLQRPVTVLDLVRMINNTEANNE